MFDQPNHVRPLVLYAMYVWNSHTTPVLVCCCIFLPTRLFSLSLSISRLIECLHLTIHWSGKCYLCQLIQPIVTPAHRYFADTREKLEYVRVCVRVWHVMDLTERLIRKIGGFVTNRIYSYVCVYTIRLNAKTVWKFVT